jgi:hypothetical protein
MSTTTKTTTKKDLQRAEELMRVYAQSEANKKALEATIANELKAYTDNMKEAKQELIEIGERNRDQFDADDNLQLEQGYLHVAKNSVVQTMKKFNMAEFLEQKSDFVKIDFEKARIKKAWNDIDQHNELIELGVQVTTEEEMQVIANKVKREA